MATKKRSTKIELCPDDLDIKQETKKIVTKRTKKASTEEGEELPTKKTKSTKGTKTTKTTKKRKVQDDDADVDIKKAIKKTTKKSAKKITQKVQEIESKAAKTRKKAKNAESQPKEIALVDGSDSEIDMKKPFNYKETENGTQVTIIDMFPWEEFDNEETRKEDEERERMERELEGNCARWSVEYRPTKLSEFAGNKDVVESLSLWFDAFTEKKMQYIDRKGREVKTTNGMIIHGPTGCGKTCLVYALCESKGYEVEEFNVSKTLKHAAKFTDKEKQHVHEENKNTNFIVSHIKTIMMRPRLPGEKPVAILIDDADIIGNGKQFYEQLARLLMPRYQTAKYSTEISREIEDDIVASVGLDEKIDWFPPVFLTVKDHFVETMKMLKKPYRFTQRVAAKKKKADEEEEEEEEYKKGGTGPKVIASYVPCSIVYMKPPDKHDIQRRLIKICEKNDIITSGVDYIAEGCFGDVRKAVDLLQECTKVLDGRSMNRDYVVKTVNLYNDSDSFGGLAVDQTKLFLSQNWSSNQFLSMALSCGNITKLYLWHNMFELVQGNYGKRSHPIMKSLNLPKEKRFRDDPVTFTMQPMNIDDVVFKMSDSLSIAGLFEAHQYDGGDSNTLSHEYGSFFNMVVPAKYVKYPGERGTTDVGLWGGQLHTPNFSLLSTTNKGAKSAKELCFRKNIPQTDWSLWEFSTTFASKLRWWIHRDLRIESLNACIDGLHAFIRETRRRINYEYLVWKKQENYDNEKTELYDMKRKQFKYHVSYGGRKFEPIESNNNNDTNVKSKHVIDAFTEIIMGAFPHDSHEKPGEKMEDEEAEVGFGDYCLLIESEDGLKDILHIDLRSIPNSIFEDFKAVYKCSIQSLLLPSFTNKGVRFTRQSSDPGLEKDLLDSLETDLLVLRNIYEDVNDTTLLNAKRIFDPAKEDLFDGDDEHNVMDDNADNIDNYLDEFENLDPIEESDNPFLDDVDTTVHPADTSKSLMDLHDSLEEKAAQFKKPTAGYYHRNKLHVKLGDPTALLKETWEELERSKNEVSALLVALGFLPRDIAVMSKYQSVNREIEICPQVPWLEMPKKKSPSLADRMSKFLEKANKFGFGITNRKIKCF